MIEKIAMWGGIAGIVVALFAIIIIWFIRNGIIDTLDRDVVMFDKNYELKKEAIEKAFNCLDYVSTSGLQIKNNPQYTQKAKEAYNALLCTVTSPALYQEFYRLAVDRTTSGYTISDIEKFKIECRNELIGKRKNKHEGFKGATIGALDDGGFSAMPTRPMPQPRPQPTQPRPTQARTQGQVPPQNNNEN